jgi:hypothetical protein
MKRHFAAGLLFGLVDVVALACLTMQGWKVVETYGCNSLLNYRVVLFWPTRSSSACLMADLSSGASRCK